MHELLIRANLALFKGEYQEVTRLLSAYRSQLPAEPPDSMVIWLEAQAQPDQADRVRLLQNLSDSTRPDELYGLLAREALAVEGPDDPDSKPRRFPRPVAGAWLRAAMFIVIGVVVAVAGNALLSDQKLPEVQTVIVTTTPIPDAQATALNLPDASQQLVAGAFQARYPGGILQLRAYEDRSERVIDTRTEQILSPVPGARFFAVKAAFECRASICSTPPEAAIALQTDGGEVIPVREDARLFREDQMQAVALGRTTEGWLIFEVPVTFRAEAVVVTPRLANGTTGESVSIELSPRG